MKRHAPATGRNSGPIAAVLDGELPAHGTVLEIASGSGEHALFFARRFPHLVWQPSDREFDALASIAVWREEEGTGNLLPPIELDASSLPWPAAQADAVVCINMIHISPWAATEGLFAGAAAILPKDAPLIVYGPFTEPEVETVESNLAFDANLRSRNPAWGLRDRAAVDAQARDEGFIRSARYAMPANNLILVYRRRS
ncbi:DUF938 domain-containing protein [Pelagerythrobacter aerophilus]|uniref:DUF938 domain-containing protein n=1 Tax=Pelagerythrobacter aerophilus TaxID=2306995 RepID=A0A418NI72_9SPHN|nr:DUF938 domain-containing protein [Pelagerythrobacter aerophilus]RIV78634.1 DUF938 domain-containing protein [Pelagerythrobacter aerophilus]